MAEGTVVLNQTLVGQEVKNVWVFTDIPVTFADMQEFADELRSILATDIASFHAPDWSLDSLTFIFNDSPPVFSIDVNFTSGPLVGTSTDEFTATQLALLISTKALAGPPNRGRVYVAGINEGDLTDGLWSVAVTEAWQGVIEFISGTGVPYASTAATMVISSRTANGQLAGFNSIDVVVGQRIPATQRRRRIGVGS